MHLHIPVRHHRELDGGVGYPGDLLLVRQDDLLVPRLPAGLTAPAVGLLHQAQRQLTRSDLQRTCRFLLGEAGY